MKNKELLKHLKFFIEPHPIFEGSDEDIYSVKDGLKIKLWITGGFEIDLESLTFEINFNSIKRRILVISNREKGNVIRILSNQIIALELVRKEDFNENLSELFALRDIQKN